MRSVVLREVEASRPNGAFKAALHGTLTQELRQLELLLTVHGRTGLGGTAPGQRQHRQRGDAEAPRTGILCCATHLFPQRRRRVRTRHAPARIDAGQQRREDRDRERLDKNRWLQGKPQRPSKRALVDGVH